MRQDSYIAATRFGLGMRPADLATIEAGPQQWLLAQLKQPDFGNSNFAQFPTSQAVAQRVMQVQQQIKQAKDAGRDPNKMMEQDFNHGLKEIFEMEMLARFRQAAMTNTPYYERLVDFWSNHFTIATQKAHLPGIAGAFEREAIRPYVLGGFREMLLAVAHHPAMLLYLDNAQSIGPNSQAGQKSHKGLNENLAREIMELHTLGVNGGYTQTDVTNFAKVLTGWSIGNEKQGTPGAFYFYPPRHEPGNQVILGKTYPDNGEQQAIDVLTDLARSPATARHIAFKLARHFIADEPPQTSVDHLAKIYMQTGGNLMALSQALVGMPEAWSVATPKIKRGYDLIVSTVRLCGAQNLPPMWPLQSLQFLSDLPMNATSPAGYPDTAADVAGPEAIMRRIEWAQSTSAKLTPAGDYRQLAEYAMGPIMSDTTRQTLASAANPREGLALLLASPDFQRR